FVLRPKLPLPSFFHLLDPFASCPPSFDHAKAVPGTEALNFLAGQLVRLFSERLRAGLHRTYAEREAHGAVLQGRIDLAEQLRDPAVHKTQLHSRFDDLTRDIPCNQLPRATAEHLLRSPFLQGDVRAALEHCLAAVPDVRSLPMHGGLIAAATPDRSSTDYQPIWELCQFLAENLSPTTEAGSVSCPSFLLNMDQVFERYVTAGIMQ